ncbi:MAG: hypothetical protein AB8H79_22045 [Myxococcota bacterium]
MRNLMLISTLALAACGVGDSTLIADLDAEDATKVCEEFEARTIECEFDGGSIEIELGADCSAPFVAPPEACTATVGDYRACYGAYADLDDAAACEAEGFPTECEPLFAASCVGSAE